MAVLVLKIKIKNLRIGCIKSANDIIYPDIEPIMFAIGWVSRESLKNDVIF